MAPKDKAPRRSTSKRQNTGPSDPAPERMEIGGTSGEPTRQPTWPRDKPTRIKPRVQFGMTDVEVVKTKEFRTRPIHEYWDDYDTLLYNAWIKNVTLLPTRYADCELLRNWGIFEKVEEIWGRMGIGHMGWLFHGYYPDLVYQFFASCRIEYTDPLVTNANGGSLSFMANGTRYKISFNEICEQFGQRQGGELTQFPDKFVDADILWAGISTSAYDSRGGSTHGMVRHPALRYILKMISGTILGKMEPGKTRLGELILLHYGIGHLYDEYYLCPDSAPPPRDDVNFGAIFAYQLVSHQIRGVQPSRGATKKTMTLGGLLTPIFRKAGVPLHQNTPDYTKAFFDVPHLKQAKFLTGNGDYQFITPDGELSIPLPTPYTRIESYEDLLFDPPRDLCSTLARSVRRGASSSARPSTAEDALVFGDPADPGFVGLVPPDFSAYEPPPRPDPTDQIAVNEWMMETAERQTSVFRRIWDVLSCVRRPAIRESTGPSSASRAAGPSSSSRVRRREPSHSTTDTDDE